MVINVVLKTEYWALETTYMWASKILIVVICGGYSGIKPNNINPLNQILKKNIDRWCGGRK